MGNERYFTHILFLKMPLLKFFLLILLTISPIFIVTRFISNVALYPPWMKTQTKEEGLFKINENTKKGEFGHIFEGVINDPKTDHNLNYEHVVIGAKENECQLHGWYIEGEIPSAILCIHGGGSDRREFLRHVPYLHEQGYGVLLFDLSAHGVSLTEKRV